MHDEDRPRVESAMQEHMEGRVPRFEVEYRVRHPGGEWHWLLARGRCSFDAAGKPSSFVGSAMDITDQKQAQLERERLEAQLRHSQKMEAVGTLAGGIAHDFNNVLGAILGYGELALQHAAGNSALRRYLDNVMHAAERAKLLVERILGLNLYTVPELLQRRYSPSARVVGGVVMLVYDLMVSVTATIAVGSVMEVIVGIPRTTAIFISSGVMVAYSVLGGMWSITLTDFAAPLFKPTTSKVS